MVFTDTQKIGIFLLCFSIFFAFFGILMFFDGGLLSVANLLMLPGIVLLFGFERMKQFCFQQQKLKGLTAFALGVLLVILGRTLIGFLLEILGFINLFADFFPAMLSFVKTLIGSSWRLILGN